MFPRYFKGNLLVGIAILVVVGLLEGFKQLLAWLISF